uniref:TPR repeats-like protein n=1 Tax=Taiwania cryptomerioides TaxID=50187 RepID=A9P324_TAICR|nr:TPR repeats-like protein [Taiwania cryptomerioides]
MAKCHRIALPCPVLPLSLPVVYGKRKIMAGALAESSKNISIGRRAVFLSLPPLLMHYHCPPVEAEVYEKETQKDKEASYALEKRVGEAIMLLEKGRELQANADFPQALKCFTQVIDTYGDLALTEYARVGRAISLYEVGDREESIAEMEDVSVSLKGYPEVHAALAAAFYVDKKAPLLAERQFTIATLLDPRYTDLSYVRDTKHWPPKLNSFLRKVY